MNGKTKYIYAPTLDQLRELERTVQKEIDDGVNYCEGNVTVIDIVKRYISIRKDSVRYNTTVGYNFVINLLEKEEFSKRIIRTVRPSDVKIWYKKLHADGRSYSTITTVKGVMRPAFKMAVEDSVIRYNPFDFSVTEVVQNDTVNRNALSRQEQKKFLEYLTTDEYKKRYYNEVVILLETGMRISELYGLTISDVDFILKRVKVDKQLARTRLENDTGLYYIESPKTKSGNRFIPMSRRAELAFKDAIASRKRPDIETMVGGYTGFIFLDKDGKPKVAGHLEHALQRIVAHYNDTHADKIRVTPHVLRHTFCTNMAKKGMRAKDLQYLMGHADVSTTLNTYTHVAYEDAEEAFRLVANER